MLGHSTRQGYKLPLNDRLVRDPRFRRILQGEEKDGQYRMNKATETLYPDSTNYGEAVGGREGHVGRSPRRKEMVHARA